MARSITKAIGPSWYGDKWIYRYPFRILNGGGGSSTVKASITVPTDSDWFWLNLGDETDGFDAIITGPDGTTLLAFEYVSFTFSTRQLVIRVNDLDISTTAGVGIIWLYWGNPNATDLSVSVTAGGTTDTDVTLQGPAPLDLRLTARADAPGDTLLRDKVQKSSLAEIPIWVNVTGWIQPRIDAYNGRTSGSGLKNIAFDVQQSSASVPALFDLDKIEYIETPDGAHWISVAVKAGTTANNYTCILTAETSDGYTRSYRWQLTVKDSEES